MPLFNTLYIIVNSPFYSSVVNDQAFEQKRGTNERLELTML